MTLTKIISGGQTGADQGGLAAAQELGLKTGGYIAKGFLTETGPNQAIALRFGMWEHNIAGYPSRTAANVRMSDGTLIFGTRNSSGTKLTDGLCRRLGKPQLFVYWKPGVITTSRYDDFRSWLTNHKIQTLNVAGNRESANPGIFDAVKQFLIESLKERTTEKAT